MLHHKESWVPKNWCFWTMVLEKTLESFLGSKFQSVYPKKISPEYSLEGGSFNILATWCEELTHLKRPQCWERLKAGGDGDSRWWDGWMTSPTGWTCIWASSKSMRWSRETWRAAVYGVTKSRTRLREWTN